MIDRYATDELVVERRNLDQYSEVESVVRTPVRGMFQHAFRVVYTPTGAMTSANAWALLPPGTQVDVGDVLEWRGKRFRVVRVDRMTSPPFGNGEKAVETHVEVWVA